MSTIQDRVISIIADKLSIEKSLITPEATFVEDLGADSLDTVELVMALEEEFSIEIPDDEAEKIRTLGDVLAFIAKKAPTAA